MRYIISLFVLLSGVLSSCASGGSDTSALKQRIQALEKELSEVRDAYKPELSQNMALIQQHHAKLWFAGTSGNWELAHYQLHELEESFDLVGELHEGDEEIQMLSSIYAPIEALEREVTNHDAQAFRAGFDELTATCNSCHRSAGHSYNRIQRPSKEPVGNQIYAPAP
jgi:predicted deacylase